MKIGKIESISWSQEIFPNQSLSSIEEKIRKLIFAFFNAGKFKSPYAKPHINYRRLTNQHNHLVTWNNIASVSQKMKIVYWIIENYKKNILENYNIKNIINNTFEKNESIKYIWNTLNSVHQKLIKIYNAKDNIDEAVITTFIEWLKKFRNQGGTIVFTGWFDSNIMDILSGNVTELKMEDGKVKVSFTLDDGTPMTDEVELKDAFCTDFSFHCVTQ